MAGKLEIDFGDSLVRVRVALRLKRRVADEKLVCKHAKTPHIDICIVRKTFDHLRRQVVQRAAQRLAPAVGRVHRPARGGEGGWPPAGRLPSPTLRSTCSQHPRPCALRPSRRSPTTRCPATRNHAALQKMAQHPTASGSARSVPCSWPVRTTRSLRS